MSLAFWFNGSKSSNSNDVLLSNWMRLDESGSSCMRMMESRCEWFSVLAIITRFLEGGICIFG